jgi:hypothetical protein
LNRRTVVEGHKTTEAFAELCRKHRIDAPILEQVRAILVGGTETGIGHCGADDARVKTGNGRHAGALRRAGRWLGETTRLQRRLGNFRAEKSALTKACIKHARTQLASTSGGVVSDRVAKSRNQFLPLASLWLCSEPMHLFRLGFIGGVAAVTCLPLLAQDGQVALSNAQGASIVFSQDGEAWNWTDLKAPGGPESGWSITEWGVEIATTDQTDKLNPMWSPCRIFGGEDRLRATGAVHGSSPATGLFLRPASTHCGSKPGRRASVAGSFSRALGF